MNNNNKFNKNDRFVRYKLFDNGYCYFIDGNKKKYIPGTYYEKYDKETGTTEKVELTLSEDLKNRGYSRIEYTDPRILNFFSAEGKRTMFTNTDVKELSKIVSYTFTIEYTDEGENKGGDENDKK